MRKWYSLIDKVYRLENLQDAFKQVYKNKGASGIDGESVYEFKSHLEERLYQLHEELKGNRYHPHAVKRVYIDKPDGSKRPLGIPTVRDRVVQQALLNVLEPIFEPGFHPSSYGYRSKRSAAHAVAKAERFSRYYGLNHVVDMDLSKCFDTLDHALILEGVAEKVSDGKVLGLIARILKAGVMESGNYHTSSIGSPQGGVISPLLMNIYLDRFDQYMKGQGIRIVRYADDILIFCRSKSEAGRCRYVATNFLENELLLKVNNEKTHLTDLNKGIPYLGFTITWRGVLVSRKSIHRFKDKIRSMTPRNHGKSVGYFIRELRSKLIGFANYYRIAQCKSLFRDLMSWIRRRLRMKKMKEWKSWKALHKQLRRMGYQGEFTKISVTRWRNSKSQLIQMALPNTWFEEKGLYDMTRVTTNTLHQYYDFVLNKV